MYERRDGARGELVCSGCGGHIGHLYRGEGFDNPPPNERHCVNSSALVFEPAVRSSRFAAWRLISFAELILCGQGAEAELVRPGYAGAVYISSYTEDSETVYTQLEGAEEAVAAAGAEGGAVHGMARRTGGGDGPWTTQLTLRPYVKGTGPHIVEAASVGGAAEGGGGLDGLGAALAAAGVR